MNGLARLFEATMLDTGGDQGEMLVLPLQFVVAPDHGRFYPAALSPAGDGALGVTCGMLLGEVRNGTASQQVRSPFSGVVDTWLVWDGQIVAPGQLLCSLRAATPANPPMADAMVGD
jgi:hypothetical protein